MNFFKKIKVLKCLPILALAPTVVTSLVGCAEVITNHPSIVFENDALNENLTLVNQEGETLSDFSNVKIGTKITVIVKENSGIEFVYVNGVKLDSTMSFEISLDIPYIISVEYDENHKFGTISFLNNEDVNNFELKDDKGETIDKSQVLIGTKVVITPKSGVTFKSIYVNDTILGEDLSFVIDAPKNYTILVVREGDVPQDKKLIKISDDIKNGVVTFKDHSNGDFVQVGTTVEIKVTPNQGYTLDTLTVNSKDIKLTSKFVIESGVDAYIVMATFKEDSTPIAKVGQITFSNIPGSPNNAVNLEMSNISQTDIDVTSVETSNGVYKGEASGTLRFSSSKNSGKLKFNFGSSHKIYKVELIGERFNSSDSGSVRVACAGDFIDKNIADFGTKLAFDFNGRETNSLEISSPAKTRFVLKEVNIHFSSNGGGDIDNPGKPEEKVEGSVLLTAGPHGTAKADKIKGFSGDLIQITTTPDTGYYTSSVLVDGVGASYAGTNTYTFILKPNVNNVVVTFKESTHSGDFGYLYGNNKIKPSRGNQSSIDNYYESCRGLKGPALKAELHRIIDGHNTYSYDALKSTFLVTDVDPENHNNIIFTYEGSLRKGTSFNREHTWAKSHGDFGTSRPCGTDMHHLRPCDSSLNSTRGNFEFTYNPNGYDAYTSGKYSWGRKTMQGNLCGNGKFEPKDEFKGDVARMIFYMATRYEGNGEKDLEVSGNIDASRFYTFNNPNPQGEHGDFNALYEWATTSIDPVSDFEVNRNNLIDEKYQHNRNPFIDHPEFIIMIYDKSYDGPGALND